MADPAISAQAALARAGYSGGAGGVRSVADAIGPGAAAWTPGGWGAVYSAGASLPRSTQTFQDGQFGPLAPLQPYPIDLGEPPSDRPAPRRWQYPVGWNILTGQPGTEGVMLANFQVCEDYAEQPTVPRHLIEHVKWKVLALIGDDLAENIVPTPSAEKAMQGNPAKRKDFESRKAEILDWFKNPDPDGHTSGFVDWLSLILEDNLVLDAVALHVQPTLKKGAGPVDSNLGGLEYLSGDTIKPLLTLHGGRPRPPQVAYQSVMWGVPRVDLMSLLADFSNPSNTLADLQALNPILEDLLDDQDQFSADQLLYVVQNRRPRTPYGYGPIAQSLLAASILFARQTWQFEWFQSGSLPSVFLDPGESVATAEEARQLQEAINMLGGDLGGRHQVIVIPPGAKSYPQKDVDLTSQIDEWLVALLCMPFGLSISDLGLTPKIAALMSPQASKGAAQVASDRSTEAAVIPRAKTLKEQLFDVILQRYLGQTDMSWSWGIEEGGESLKDKIDQQVELVGKSIITIDEARVELGKEPLGLPETTVPVSFTPTGVVPFGSPAQEALAAGEPTQADQAAMEAKKPPPLPPALGGPPAGASGDGGPPKPPGKTPPTKPGANGNGAKKPPAAANGSSGGRTAAPPASDSHAAARVTEASSKPGGTGGRQSPSTGGTTTRKPANGNGKAAATPVAKVVAECEILRRHLKRGGALEEFEPRALPEGVLRVAKGHTSADGIVWAVTKAAKRRARRDVALDPIRQKTTATVGALANQVAAGTLGADAFTSSARDVMADGYSDAYGAGSAHAAEDLKGDAEDDWDDESATRADAQRPYLADFAAAILAGLAGTEIADRAGLYGDTMTGAYEEGYGTTASDTLDNPLITWHLGDADHCALCEERDGEQYTPDELPGWPGDGDFGDVCEGGPRCACWLEYGEGEAATDTPSGARATDLGPATAEEADAQMAGFDDGTMAAEADQPKIRRDTTKAVAAEATKAIHKAGNPDALRDWYNDGAGGQIDWGSEGDFDACVDVASQYMDDDQARGFCNLRHQDAVGGPPGTEKAVGDQGQAGVLQSPPGFDKDFGLAGPSGVSFTPFDLAGPGGQTAPNNVGERRRFRPAKRTTDFAEVVATFATPLTAAEAFGKGLWDPETHEVKGRNIVKRSGGWHSGDGLSPDASEDDLTEHILSDHSPRVRVADLPGGRDALDHFHAGLHVDHGEIGAHRVPTWADKATNGTEAWDNAQSHPDVTGSGVDAPLLSHPASMQGADIVAAGLAVRAEDTGRVLMLQRALSDGADPASGKTDPAAGKWEFPGGKLEPRETPWEAAVREWQEETGLTLPIGRVVNNWRSPNGVYEGFVYSVGAEETLPINDPAHAAVINPDDPDGDITETLAWWNPDDIPNNPGVRSEVLEGTDWRALRTPTMLTAKVGKEEVHYRPATDVAMRCGTCSMFLPEGACTLVAGTIDAAAVCDQWDPQQPS